MTTVYELLNTMSSLPLISDEEERAEVYGKMLMNLNDLAPQILNLWLAVQRLQEADQEFGPDNYEYQALVHSACDKLNTRAADL